MSRLSRPFIWFIPIYLLCLSQIVIAQKATISEEKIEIGTYQFGDPNPVPTLAEKPQIYPYHKFDGYSVEKEPVKWKIVTLGNDYIKVMVLPEVGGKVWGAIDKSNGFDFIYLNEVMKFRNIALRGPWTSGGIEFNFGYIGHTPSTASPVDYQLRENEDGSVSCFVGGLDLPSRTQWRVEVRLAPDKAYFETRVHYYNPTNTSKSYYNWMTAAARTEDELEFIYPGDEYLTHPGVALPWSIDNQGRELKFYENNAFGSHISRHVVGTYADFFGGYYHKNNVGFGHLAPYEEMPGQKLWLWALSRSGGIWEDLLTDTNGQYLEFQAGRMLNQFSGSSSHNPIAKAGFGPHTYDTWTDLWFPIKDIGGMVDASASGVLNVEQNGQDVVIGLQSLVAGKPQIQVLQNDEIVFSTKKSLTPNKTLQETVKLPTDEPFVVKVSEYDLNYSSSGPDLIDRDFGGFELKKESTSIKYHEGTELKKNRQSTKALERFEAVLSEDPYHMGALGSIAEIYLQQGQKEPALAYIKRALAVDTYDAQSNFIAGAVYQVMNDEINAIECYGWAARSMEFRAAAYMGMGGIYLKRLELPKAMDYLLKSLRFNADNLQAQHLIAATLRKSGDQISARQLLNKIIMVDPLNHLANYELDLVNEKQLTFSSKIQSELKYQSFLEMAIWYYRYGMVDEALQILNEAPDHSLVLLWKAYLDRDNANTSSDIVKELLDETIEYAFPYRPETLEPLTWLVSQSDHWKGKYLLGLNYWALNNLDKAHEYFAVCENEPDVPTFYISRSQLAESITGKGSLEDLKRALNIDKDRWRSWNYLIRSNLKNEQYEEAVSNGKTAIRKFPDNYELKLKLAEAYLFTENHQSALKLLEDTEVLPFEGASKGRSLYEQAFLFPAIKSYVDKEYDQAIQFLDKAREWPEHLGVGKPYDPDERLEDFLQAMCLRKLKNDTASKYEEQVVKYTKEHFRGSYLDVLGLIIMEPNESTELISSKGIKMESLADLSKSVKGDLYFKIVEKLVDLRE